MGEQMNNPPNDGDLSSLKIEPEIAPKKRGRKPGSVSINRQTEALGKIRTTLEMIFGASAGIIATVGVKTNNIALVNDAKVLTPSFPQENSKPIPNPQVQNLIESILVLCQQDKAVREFFLSLTTGSAYTNVVIAALPMIIAILANHNLIPPIFGSPVTQQDSTVPLEYQNNGAPIPNN